MSLFQIMSGTNSERLERLRIELADSIAAAILPPPFILSNPSEILDDELARIVVMRKEFLSHYIGKKLIITEHLYRTDTSIKYPREGDTVVVTGLEINNSKLDLTTPLHLGQPTTLKNMATLFNHNNPSGGQEIRHIYIGTLITNQLVVGNTGGAQINPDDGPENAKYNIYTTTLIEVLDQDGSTY